MLSSMSEIKGTSNMFMRHHLNKKFETYISSKWRERVLIPNRFPTSNFYIYIILESIIFATILVP